MITQALRDLFAYTRQSAPENQTLHLPNVQLFSKSRHATSLLHITYAVFRMKKLNLLHVPWTGGGESLSSPDVELWKEKIDLKYKSLLSKKVTFCVCVCARACVGDFVYVRIFVFRACLRVYVFLWP